MLTAKKMTTLALPKWWYPKFLSISLAIIIFIQLPYFNIAVYWDSWENRNLSPQFFIHGPALIYMQRLWQPCVQIPMDFRSIWTQLAQLKDSKSSCPCCQGAVELAIFTSGFTQRSNILIYLKWAKTVKNRCNMKCKRDQWSNDAMQLRCTIVPNLIVGISKNEGYESCLGQHHVLNPKVRRWIFN